MDCSNCGSDDTEILDGEFEDEPTILTCYACGTDEEVSR